MWGKIDHQELSPLTCTDTFEMINKPKKHNHSRVLINEETNIEHVMKSNIVNACELEVLIKGNELIIGVVVVWDFLPIDL